LAFTARDEDGQESIRLIDVDGTDLRRLTPFSGRWPAWSPDGSTIAFQTLEGIWTIDVWGCDERLIYESDTWIEGLVWSPDGSSVVFSQQAEDGREQLFSMSTTDHAVVHLATAGEALEPAFSPDGSLIAYRATGVDGSIWVMNSDGSNQRALYAQSENDFHPTFSPDGMSVAVERISDDGRFIAVVSVPDGSAVAFEVDHDDTERIRDPVWAPAGEVSGEPAPDTSTTPTSVVSGDTTEATVPEGQGGSASSTLPWMLLGVLLVGGAIVVMVARRDRSTEPPPPPPPA
jgi:TolB protein